MELWENEVYRFKTIGQLKVGQGFWFLNVVPFLSQSNSLISTPLQFQAISQYLPRGDLRLRPAIYEMILHEFLKTDYEVLYPRTIFLTSCDESGVQLTVRPTSSSVHKGFCHADPGMAWRAL